MKQSPQYSTQAVEGDPEIQNALHEIAFIAASHQFMIKARHISGISNRVPDWLSRWHEPAARHEFRKYTVDRSLKHIWVSSALLQYNHEW